LKTINWYVEALDTDTDTVSAPGNLYNYNNNRISTPTNKKFVLYDTVAARYNGATKEDFIEII
jgi:hypothetical protein